MRNKYLALLLTLASAYVIIFFTPGAKDALALSFTPTAQGEYWRLLTYQFIHLDATHLLENLGALAIIIMIASEANTLFITFTSSYLLAGVLSIIPLWLITPFTALGASSAIFAALGFLAMHAKTFKIKPLTILSLSALILFIEPFLSKGGCLDCSQPGLIQVLAHLSGLIFGVGAYAVSGQLIIMLEKRKRVLRRLDQ